MMHPVKSIIPKTEIQEISLETMVQARNKCARIIALHGEQYLPIFERLEKEIVLRKQKDELLQKALKIGTQNGTQNGTQLRSRFFSVSK